MIDGSTPPAGTSEDAGAGIPAETAPELANINLAAADQEHGLYARFVLGAVNEGADSFNRFMAATYLAQFSDPFKGFMAEPIFRFDYQHGIIPYSTSLREVINNSIEEGVITFNLENNKLSLPEGSYSAEEVRDNETILLTQGAQLGRLHSALKDTLKKDDVDLLMKMRHMHTRNKVIGPSLEYLMKKIK